MPDLPFEAEPAPEIQAFGDVVRTVLRDAGGFGLVMRAEREPALRERAIVPPLASLGVFDLDPYAGEDQLTAAAAACRAAGGFALPYPLAERLAAAALPGGRTEPAALGVVAATTGPRDRARVNQADLPLAWHVVDTSGRLHTAAPGAPDGGRLGPFVAEIALTGPGVAAPDDALAVAVHLQSCTLLGMLEAALELTAAHARDREQFGRPIVAFQAVQHRLAEALIRIELFERHVLYALWSLARGRDGRLTDVAAARAAGLRAADVTLRAGHQVHGATGLCDEAPISWISRHSLPVRRLPLNRPQTERWLAGLTLRGGLDGLFPAGVGSGA